MNNSEKALAAIMVFCVATFMGTVFLIKVAVDHAGGVKQVLIEAGQELKEIVREVEKHEPR